MAERPHFFDFFDLFFDFLCESGEELRDERDLDLDLDLLVESEELPLLE
jgi:hypothetical protein